MSGRCACHRNVGTCTWRTIDGRMTGEFAGDRHHVTCDACGRWLSLGPSDETPERVAIEIRAAQLAAGWTPEYGVMDGTTLDEDIGWLDHCKPDPYRHHMSDEFHAGWLAREIVTHYVLSDRLDTMRTALVAGARTCVHTSHPAGTWRYHWREGNGPRFDSDEWIEYIPEPRP